MLEEKKKLSREQRNAVFFHMQLFIHEASKNTLLYDMVEGEATSYIVALQYQNIVIKIVQSNKAKAQKQAAKRTTIRITMTKRYK